MHIDFYPLISTFDRNILQLIRSPIYIQSKNQKKIYNNYMESQIPIQYEDFNDKDRIIACKNKPELLNLNEIYQTDSGSKCGYCQKPNTSFSWSFTKQKMEPYTYELMMERGWRRCGTYYYKPQLLKSCCKLFTHRMQVAKFKPKKDQKKALKRVIALAYERVQQMNIEDESKKQQKHNNKPKKDQIKKGPIEEQISQSLKQKLQRACQMITVFLKVELKNIVKSEILNKVVSQFSFELSNKLKFFKSKPGQKSDYYSNYVMLLFGLNKKLFGQTKYQLADFIKEVKDSIESLGTVQHFKINVQRGGYLLFKFEVDSTQFQILEQKNELMEGKVEKKQQKGLMMGFIETITNKIKGKQSIQQNMPNSKKLQQKKSSNFQILKPELLYKGEINITSNKITFGKITIDIVPAEQNDESFKLYQIYNKKIHEKKQKEMSSYVNFLCLQALDYKTTESPPTEKKDTYIPAWDSKSKHQEPKIVEETVRKQLGCFHMKYYFDSKLIAVGVVDIVEDGLSSVYFFYDPEFKDYRLGVFSSLIEIQYIRWLKLSFPQFRYYYMGFYISNCQKMNYKVDYGPCELLCPITYRFVQFDEQVKLKTDKIAVGQEKDIRLAEKDQPIIEDMHFGKDIGPFIDKNIKLMYLQKKLILKEINPHFYIHILKIVKENLPVWGKKLFEIFTLKL